ncbi:DcrB-related protein [Noviherbaspirillum sp. Root189]|uniref:DcrB-related protein n=1 Tax=Noviherbaspirillum sp. Root189 TaxID=1736487 RepID=UPI00070F5FC5|nr:DcrB-related protein [Noviherbaspirillum sp. Root189]KRB77630.1 hypothetical protein ASE07_26140 [Noviherbaspirillum sp. Root189]
MTEHHINEASFKLPTELKDKTVHMFVTADDGPNEFNVVVTRADVESFETLEHFTQRLINELSESLPAFELLQTFERGFADAPAIELTYKWNNGGIAMHQRQVITLVVSVSAEIRQAIMIAATCPKPFSDHWSKVFDDLLDSVQLRRPASIIENTLEGTSEEMSISGETPSPASVNVEPSCVFSLRLRDRILHVFHTDDEACKSISAIEVEDGLWKFFDAAGDALHPEFIEPNTGKIWRTAGRYLLRPRATHDVDTLHRYLDHVQGVRGTPPMNGIAAIRTYLERSRGSSPITLQESTAG